METEKNISQPFVTVIVPTYKDWVRLRLCVNALADQSYPMDRFEVIITNNDPSDPRPAGFELPKNFAIIDVSKPGSYAARNEGLKLSKGDIIGFTDSDCIPAKDWIRNAVQHFQNNPGCSRIAGHIAIFYHKSTPTPAELYNTLYSFPQKKHVQSSGTSVTGNLFTYKKVFDQVGLFNDKQFSLGDLFWGRRAQKAGYTIHYVQDVVVQHPARNMKELIIKERRVGGGRGLPDRGKKLFLKHVFHLVNGCRPRVAEVKYIFQNGQSLGFFQKCKVALIRHYLLNVRNYEQLRVALGKKPNRA